MSWLGNNGAMRGGRSGRWHIGRMLESHTARTRMRSLRPWVASCLCGVLGSSGLPNALAQQDEPKAPPRPTAEERPIDDERNASGVDKSAIDKQGEDLGKRLLRKAVSESDEDVMATMLRLMGESERKLGIDFDPGDETRQVQSNILDKLNDAIKTAGKRRMSRGGQPSFSSDRRRAEGTPKPQPPPEANRKSSGAGSGDAEGATTPTATVESKPVRGDLQETRRTWGVLPQRERDEMIQGSSEGTIERYREWIERYYRALQESGE